MFTSSQGVDTSVVVGLGRDVVVVATVVPKCFDTIGKYTVWFDYRLRYLLSYCYSILFFYLCYNSRKMNTYKETLKQKMTHNLTIEQHES
jgi:hypothetical protein